MDNIDGKIIKCPCYIDKPLYRYDKGCLIQSQAFSEQQTKEKPVLRCDEIQNCPIKNMYKKIQLSREALLNYVNGYTAFDIGLEALKEIDS